MARAPRPRFLAPGQGNGTGYTTRPLRELPLVADEPDIVERIATATNIRDEPECIGPAIVNGYAEAAAFHRTQQHALEVAEAQARRPDITPENRLKDIQRRAKHSHVNLSREVFTMDQELRRARTGNRKVPGRVLRRMESIEGLLDGLG